MEKKNKQHQDRRTERMRQRKIKARKRRTVIIIELLVLCGVFYVAYEMNQNGRFQITDISTSNIESLEENIVDTEG